MMLHLPSGGGGKTLAISEIQLKNKNCKLEDFVAKNADLKIKNNTLIIYPKDSYFSVLYNKPLKLRASVRFEFELFVIISVLSFLIAYKLVDYIADFKTIKKHSRIDIVFLAIFFLLLFIPASHIDTETKVAENRVLAKWQPLFLKDRKINYNFGNDFNNWFNDRFNMRQTIIEINQKCTFFIHSKAVNIKNITFIKENGYIFENIYNAALKEMTNDEIELCSRNLNEFNQYCKKHKIKLYILIPPSSISFNKFYNITRHIYPPDRTLKLKTFAKQKYNLDIIYPEDILRQAEKNDAIYYKTDHHITDYGNYVLYKHLISIMSQDFPLLKITPIEDFNIYKRNLVRSGPSRDFFKGDSGKTLRINDKYISETKYTYYDYKYANVILITKHNPYYHTHYNPSNNYKLMIIGDSFQESLIYFLNTSFQKVERYRANHKPTKYPQRKYNYEIKPFYKIIEKDKPDAILLLRNSGTLEDLLDMYPKEER